MRASCAKSDSFDAVECAEVNFYGDSRGIVVLVDGVKAMKLIAKKHNLANGRPKSVPALYEHASIIKNAINLLERVFPGDPDETPGSYCAVVEACYVTVWDSGRIIESRCQVDLNTRHVFDIEAFDAPDVEILEEEYIEVPDWSVPPKCPVYAKDDVDMPEGAFWRD